MKDAQREKEWREANREMLLAYHKAYYRKHRAKQLEQAKEKYRERRTEKLAYARKRYEENPAINLKWQTANRDRYLEQTAVRTERRRALKKGAQGDGVSRQQWNAIKEEYGGRCAYCARVAVLSMDHIEPLSKGGHHNATNIAPACKSCNSAKHDASIVLWLARVAINQRINKAS